MNKVTNILLLLVITASFLYVPGNSNQIQAQIIIVPADPGSGSNGEGGSSSGSKSSGNMRTFLCRDSKAVNYSDSRFGATDNSLCIYDTSNQKACTPFFVTYSKLGDKTFEVTKIQLFLNIILGEQINPDGYFDAETKRLVQEFQNIYVTDVLDPWKLNGPTGWWYQSTRKKANEIMGCPEGPVLLDNGILLE